METFFPSERISRISLFSFYSFFSLLHRGKEPLTGEGVGEAGTRQR